MENSQALVQEYIEQGLICGAVLLVGNRDQDLCCQAYGLADHRTGRMMTQDSIFDLASVTKAIGIGSCLAFCHAAGVLDYDCEFSRYLPAYHGLPCGRIPTVRELAMHYSGLDHSKPYNRFLPTGDGEAMLADLLALPGKTAPGQEFVYTCANYILLGLLLENLTGEKLQDFAQRRLFGPLGMSASSWGGATPALRARVVHPYLSASPSQSQLQSLSPELRRLHEQENLPSDETACWALPQRIGNAGIFASATDLGKFCRWILRGTDRVLPPRTLAELYQNGAPAGKTRRSVGYSLEPQQGFSDQTIHHTGWTGQTLWIDLQAQRYVAVLTNRSGDWAQAKLARLQIAGQMMQGCPGFNAE